MALLHSDGFDCYTTPLQSWDSEYKSGTIDIDAAYGRLSTSGLRITMHSEGLSKSLGSNVGTIWGGFAINRPASVSNFCYLCTLVDSGTEQIHLEWSADGAALTWKRGGTVLRTIAVGLSVGVWYYLEFKVIFSATVGRIYTYIDNVLVDDSTASLNTMSTANAYCNAFVLGGNAASIFGSTRYYDDVVVGDTTGSFCNDRLGDVWIQTVMPTGAGTNTAWDPSAGNNWDCVEEIPPSTAEYVETAVLNEIDDYATANVVSTTGTVHAVVVKAYAQKTSAGTRKISGATTSNAVAGVGTEVALATDYHYVASPIYQNPDGPVAWTITTVNAAEFGVKLTT